jgi:phosphatidylglycerophosphate synthase
MPMPADPLLEPGVPPPDHVPDEFVRMYGREAHQSVRYSRSRRYRATKQVRRATTTLHDTELWAVVGLAFFWGVAAVSLVGALAYAVYLWPAAGIALVGTVALILGISLAIGLKQSQRNRQIPAGEYTGYSL